VWFWDFAVKIYVSSWKYPCGHVGASARVFDGKTGPKKRGELEITRAPETTTINYENKMGMPKVSG
jgi:hypothetical protein